ncbi:MAG: aspartate aminotransferase family protein, partial [Planctomycetes bacterium]|nr:aspartate aminotransferase family protein [Planctomycetota bacterium]
MIPTNPPVAAGRRVELPVCSHQPMKYGGPAKSQVVATRKQYLSPGLLLYYREPVMLVEGKMQYVWDETGKRYLDCFGGIVTVSVGHCHPRVSGAVVEQAQQITHTTPVYLHPTMGQYARRLAEHMPAGSGLEVTYFTNSGSESNDLAVLMARLHTGRFDVIALRNGYHGGSQATMGLTAQSTWKFPVPHAFGVHFTVPGYCYRCPFGLNYPSCELRCARDAAEVIRYETPGQVACFIGECIQGVGGVVMPPREYFQIVYEAVRQAGGICVADEVQGGFGRTGEHFWSFEHWDVTPDMVTMAKGIGNGVPLGAVTTRMEIARPLAERLHFNTFGGNPVQATYGLATLEVIDSEGIQENALKIGTQLKNGLTALMDKHALIGEVRGLGLM